MVLTALDLVTHDDAEPTLPALFLEGQSVLSYEELAGLVTGAERVLRRDAKALVLCAGDRDLPTLVGYLAALRLGHAAAFLPATAEVLEAYQPEFVIPAPGGEAGLADLGYRLAAEPVAGAAVFERDPRPAGEIFAGLGLLLGTSGSTGSPKTVRLSYAGLAANTAAVITALGITAADRAPTTLPVTHAYGLSVLNTHLLAGAAVILGGRPPLSLAAWDHLLRSGATSFAAVPTTYAAFGPAHVKLLDRSQIRTMTQSGARLGDDLTLRLAGLMTQRQGRFFVMYGQTEATSRITRLDPADLPARLGSVGTPVTGGTLTITPAPASAHVRAVPGEGAVYFRGPGVMLGYAAGRADLSRGAGTGLLDTGDLGYLREGYLYLTGRTKRIVKVLGVRASLDDLERLIEHPGHPTALTCGTDDILRLAGAGDPAVHEQQRRQLAEVLGIPARHVTVRHLARLPATPGGKTDYQALADPDPDPEERTR